MSIWAIADIHASQTDSTTGRPQKPMDVFGSRWERHVERLEASWVRDVQPDDTVLICGDTDWALHLEDALETLHRINSWPGRKLLLRGNHDYWWSSKTTNKVRKVLPASIQLLHNNAFEAEGFNICGTKGSPVPGGVDWTEQHAVLLNREEQRLKLSLEARSADLPTIAAFHYPPFYENSPRTSYTEILREAGVGACVYGHLHGDAAEIASTGTHAGIHYFLVSSDAVRFQPVKIAENKRILELP